MVYGSRYLSCLVDWLRNYCLRAKESITPLFLFCLCQQHIYWHQATTDSRKAYVICIFKGYANTWWHHGRFWVVKQYMSYERHDVSTRRQLDALFNSFSVPHQGNPVDSPHKWTVMHTFSISWRHHYLGFYGYALTPSFPLQFCARWPYDLEIFSDKTDKTFITFLWIKSILISKELSPFLHENSFSENCEVINDAVVCKMSAMLSRS